MTIDRIEGVTTGTMPMKSKRRLLVPRPTRSNPKWDPWWWSQWSTHNNRTCAYDIFRFTIFLEIGCDYVNISIKDCF